MTFFAPWIAFAFIAAFSSASNAIVNQYFKVASLSMLVWVRFIVSIAVLPVALQFPFPTDLRFYLACIGAVLCFSYFDVIYFRQAAKSGAGIVTRFEGFVVGITFIAWLLFDPSLIVEYAEKPLKGLGIICSLSGAIYFGLKLKKCDVSFSALKQMLPALIAAGFGIVFGKLSMQYSDYHSGVWHYALFQSVSVFSIYLLALFTPKVGKVFALPDESRALFDRRVIQAAICVALGWLIHTPAKYYAITDVENPAYVTIIGLTSPLWVLLAYKLVKHQENADVLSGLGVLFCAISLVFFTRF